MTELQIVPNTTTELPAGVAHVPSTPHQPIVVLKALIGGVEQTWYVYGDDDEDVAHKLPRVHRYIQELRKRFGGEEVSGSGSGVPGSGFRVPGSQPETRDQQPETTNQRPETHECEWHGPMRASTKAPGTWYCPKRMASGEFCKEKWPKKAGESAS